MAYPDIKEPRAVEQIYLAGACFKVLLVLSAPVWITAYVKLGQEGFWPAVGIAAVASVGLACLIVGLLPQRVLLRLRESLGLSGGEGRG